jgi:hypothetical protein
MMGLKFGHWTVVEIGLRVGRHKACRCVCDCGKESVQIAGKLRFRGDTQSCGCFKGASISAAKRVHGDAKTVEYKAWGAMKTRCTNKKLRQYPDYGGRGIAVCERWRDSFENFLADMGRRPTALHTLDRIDNDGPYSPENCRWATRTEQARNKRSNVIVTHNGDPATVAEWCERLGLHASAVRQRIHKGKTPRQALGLDP